MCDALFTLRKLKPLCVYMSVDVCVCVVAYVSALIFSVCVKSQSQ